jgi:hypothetical protein
MGTLGWNYWLFNENQFVTDNTKSLGEFQKYLDDISQQESDTEYLGKEAFEEWTIGTDSVNDDEWQGLKTLFNSPVVKLLINPDTWMTDGARWITVKIEPGKMIPKQTQNVNHVFECVLKLPTINLQQQ